MSKFRKRPKGVYISEASWEELDALTKHWESDLQFYKDDILFFHHLIDKYFIWITKKENLDQVRDIEVTLNDIDKQCTALLTRVKRHIKHIEEIIENAFTYDSHKFREEHQELEDEITDFIKLFRDSRKQVFSITEYVVEAEKR